MKWRGSNFWTWTCLMKRPGNRRRRMDLLPSYCEMDEIYHHGPFDEGCKGRRAMKKELSISGEEKKPFGNETEMIERLSKLLVEVQGLFSSQGKFCLEDMCFRSYSMKLSSLSPFFVRVSPLFAMHVQVLLSASFAIFMSWFVPVQLSPSCFLFNDVLRGRNIWVVVWTIECLVYFFHQVSVSAQDQV